MSIEVAVIGTGYVGTTTGACLAKEGHTVTCVDIDRAKVDTIMDGRAPIEEPRLDEIISEAVSDGNLRATTELGKAVSSAQVVLLALPTPSVSDGSAELKHVFGAASELAEHLRPGAVVATRSTVPVGTTDAVRSIIASQTRRPFLAVSNPEFLAEGTAVENTLHPDRIVVGTDSDEAADIMSEMYHPFVLDNPNKIVTMSVRSAELTKLVANTLLASQITIVNVAAEIAERTGADWREVQVGVGLDPRVGRFLHPGPGYGGSCFPKDVRAMAYLAKQIGVDSRLLDAVSETNEQHKRRLFEKVRVYFDGDLAGKTLAVWGLSFKPNTDDIRESSALSLISDLTDSGARVVAYDPKAMDRARNHFGDNPNLAFAENKYDATKGADALVIVTEWDGFRSADLDHLGEIMQKKVIFDGRSIYRRETMEKAGFYYDSVGRQVVNPWQNQ
jgi:UDPglucose 6-dehydrogenase